MFLYGMHVMSDSMQVIAGSKLNNAIKNLTSKTLFGIGIGALLTIILSSSSATTVMVVGLVNAEIMTLNQAVGVIMGANIGTTFTAWIVSLSQLGNIFALLSPTFYAPAILGIAVFVNTFAKKSRQKNISLVFIGIGFLFVGLTFMQDGVSPYSELQIFKDVFVILGNNPLLGILAGTIVTSILQSSAASVSILQMLAYNGVIGKGAAYYITIGQNIGTCMTAILSSTNASKNAKRTALLHLLFNLFGGMIFLIILFFSHKYINDYLSQSITSAEISLFHTGFNVINTMLLFPITKVLVSITKKIIPDKNLDVQKMTLSEKTYSILDERILEQPALALSTVKNEIIYFAKYTKKNVERSISLMIDKRDEDLINDIIIHEKEIDLTNRILTRYLVKINSLTLDVKQHMQVEKMISMCSDIERMGDHAENISESADTMIKEDVNFTGMAIDELKIISHKVIESLDNIIECMEKKDMELVKKARILEEEIDEIEERYKDIHIKRMSNGECNTIAGIAFIDTIGNLERVADHVNNIADYVENELNGL